MNGFSDAPELLPMNPMKVSKRAQTEKPTIEESKNNQTITLSFVNNKLPNQIEQTSYTQSYCYGGAWTGKVGVAINEI